MKLLNTVEKLCMPAKVYLLLTVISTLMYVGMMVKAETDKHPESKINVHTYTLAGLFFKLAFAIIWVVFLNYLCSKGHKGWAWFFLVMPIILMTFFIILTTFAVAYVTGGMLAHGQTLQELKGHQDLLQDTIHQQDTPLPPEDHHDKPLTNNKPHASKNPFEGFSDMVGEDYGEEYGSY